MIHDISETLDLKYEDNTLPVQYDVFSLPLKEISVAYH